MRSIGDVSVPFRLADGTDVILRPIAPSGREYIRTGFRSMSLLSRYRRFFAYSPRLSDAQLSYLTEVDQINHVAWVGVARDSTPAAGLGVARFLQISEQPDVAEFSFAVIDAVQRKGLGRALLTMLYLSAAEGGVRILRAVCLPENQSVVSWLYRLGAETRGCSQETVELDLHVEEISNFSATCGSTADRFARSLDYLGRALAEARAKPRSRSDNECAGHDEPARHSTCNQQRGIPKHETTP